MNKKDEIFLSSKEMMKELKISSCELMHQGENGKLEYLKKGNAYFYKKK
ncbi:MAG: hypothetical protein OXC03_03400 [Flavobacteriaceae bacterium]|nr:hypothetical protein [Flavobacteriaceae bacterium]